jgi:hypothetical protein
MGIFRKTEDMFLFVVKSTADSSIKTRESASLASFRRWALQHDWAGKGASAYDPLHDETQSEEGRPYPSSEPSKTDKAYF